ncbi:MAG: NUMOD3 domain-containing DNA-binding protein [Bacteroidales bacterium]|jgi:hypothetical protein
MSDRITNIPYTYVIGWSILNIFYYGVQYGKTANPNNLWNNYFTSSKYVKEFRELYGEPDIIKIRKTFKTKEQAIQWERKVIDKMNIVFNDIWLNRANGSVKFSFCEKGENNPNFGRQISKETKEIWSENRKGYKNPFFGKLHTDETKEKISISKKGTLASIETKEKMSQKRKGENNSNFGKIGIQSHWFGKSHTEETKEKLRIANLGKHNISCKEETKQKISKSNLGKKHTIDTKKYLSEINKGKITVFNSSIDTIMVVSTNDYHLHKGVMYHHLNSKFYKQWKVDNARN